MHYNCGKYHPMWGKKHILKTRIKMSNSAVGKKNHNYGIHLKTITKKKLSIRMTGIGNPMYGKRGKLAPNYGNHFGGFYGHHHNKKTKLKISKSLTGRKFFPEHIKNLKIARAKRIIPFNDTKPEKLLQKELKRRKIKFKKHVPLLGQPDIFIEPNICIFADGDYWHGNPKIYKPNKLIGILKSRKPAKYKWIYDKSITRRLRYQGYIVLRFWESDIYKDIKLIGTKIESVIYEMIK